jgi:glutamate carboxypeptidase
VVAIEALRALHAVGALQNTTIRLLFTGDEENYGTPSSKSREKLIELARQSDAALAFEASVRKDGKPTATVGRRGSSTWHLVVKARQGHSQGIFGDKAGFGAVFEASRMLDNFRRELASPGLTFSPGVIVGGTDVDFDPAASEGKAFGRSNVIAGKVEVKGDLRFMDEQQKLAARARMKSIADAPLHGATANASISFLDGYPSMKPTAGNRNLLKKYSRASNDAGLGKIAALPQQSRGAGDVSWVAPYVDSLDGLGANGQGAHSRDESVDVRSIEEGTIRAALLLYRLTR